MIGRGAYRLALLGMLLSMTACVSVRPPSFLQIPSDRDWGPTLARARQLASEGRGAQADSVLAQFAAAYPAAPQAVEASYWRALLNLRAPAPNSATIAAIPLLQTYLAAGPTTEHWMEAEALLRAASRVDTLTRMAATYVSRGEVATDLATATAKAVDANAKADAKTVAADTKAQDEEIKRLKDELAKANTELERIRKRLSSPPPKP